ncbi:cytochrome d ubiquinol oxidase subunit II [Haloactinopolyspora alba]|uniref:Cytochrome d ubiquinol oxidase subunit II n=1 Tax=Haloactinopolyspora alba TaxID=648780 RepID=A0A2P8EB27_9ACTN|nr:cytochrome d ubiquinol oxidase subunit II [Haloactinopolyspora alba]PSL06676.1 cytochrome d ubiquinol oxidase subunit II [Haloactinopolyspora alba]
MDTVWLLTLGVMVTGWFVLDGANLGLGMTMRAVGGDGVGRRLVLTALGPFLLAGEVWLVAAAGVLIGAFPGLEKDLLGAFYPLVVALVVTWILRDAGVWFRSRLPGDVWRDGWERVVVLAGGGFAFVWGLLLANVVQGVPRDGGPGVETLVGPYSLLWGVTMVAVFAVHGAAFAALRLPDRLRTRAHGVAGRAGAVVPPLVLAVAAATPLARTQVARPVPAFAVAAVATVAATLAVVLLRRGDVRHRPGRVYACTAVTAACAPIAVGVGTTPRLLEGAAGPRTLDLLAAIALPAVPVLIAVQAWMWWLFRRRVGEGSAVFF